MVKQMGLPTREIPPPLVFPPYGLDLPHDCESLGERMSALRRERSRP
jgi:hypothetical protein